MGSPALDLERTSLDRPTRMTDEGHLYGETGTSVGRRSPPTGSAEQPHVAGRRRLTLRIKGERGVRRGWWLWWNKGRDGGIYGLIASEHDAVCGVREE